MRALSTVGGVRAPDHIRRHEDAALTLIRAPGLPDRWAALFSHIEGRAPEETGDLADHFEALGAIAARCHLHAETWTPPEPFERLRWDAEAILGEAPTWGDWRAAPNLSSDDQATLEHAEEKLLVRLGRYGAAHDRFGLIHGDMRLANVILSKDGPRLIDFDDCGFGWFMYDFAAAISFIEDDPRVPVLRARWLSGYKRIREMTAADEAALDDMVMLRRLALLAWMGSHIEAPEPQALAPDFAARTARLARRWMAG